MATVEETRDAPTSNRVTTALIAQEELIQTIHSLLNSLKTQLERVSVKREEEKQPSLVSEVTVPIGDMKVGDAIERNNRMVDEANIKIGRLIDYLEI
jgi:hypothetical protein